MLSNFAAFNFNLRPYISVASMLTHADDLETVVRSVVNFASLASILATASEAAALASTFQAVGGHVANMHAAAPALLTESTASVFRMVHALGNFSDAVNRATELMGGGEVGIRSSSSSAVSATTFDRLPFDIAFEDLSWEFTLFGDVDVSTESLGLPDIPADLALKLSWVGDVAVTLQGLRTYGSTFVHAVNVTATLDIASAGIEVHLEVGRAIIKTSLMCPNTCLHATCDIYFICVMLTSHSCAAVFPTSRARRRSRRRASTGSS